MADGGGGGVVVSRPGHDDEKENIIGDSDGGDSGDDPEEMELAVDEHGRVTGTSGCGLDFQLVALRCPVVVVEETPATSAAAAAESRAAGLGELQEDCRVLFGHEDSHWLPAAMRPRCALERLAADVFRYHTRAVSDLPGNSGAEWWVQVREAGASSSSAAESIGFHWDKDEDLVDSCGISLHPQLSTVTYLSSCGAPTMICSRRAPLRYDDTEALHSPENDFTSAHLSYPSCSTSGGRLEAKHIAFDGQLLHGAPKEFSIPGRDQPGETSTRFTFLVNIWLGHTPVGLTPLPEEALASLSNTAVKLDLWAAQPCSRAAVQAGAAAQRYSATFGPTGTQHELSFGFPSLPNDPSGGCTLDVDLTHPEAQGRIRPAPRPELSEAPTFRMSDGITWPELQEAFLRFQLLVVRGAQSDQTQPLGLHHLRRLYLLDPSAVQLSWDVEIGDADAHSAGAILQRPAAGAPSEAKRPRLEPWYASFGLSSTCPSLAQALEMLPVREPGFLPHTGDEQPGHSPGVRFFLGQNLSGEALEGRPEQTDGTQSSGTWHVQQSGEKVWTVRPDEEAEWPAGPCPLCRAPLEVRVGPGDIILINTRLWYHRTLLPGTAGAPGQLSLSYARGFYLGSDAPENESPSQTTED